MSTRPASNLVVGNRGANVSFLTQRSSYKTYREALASLDSTLALYGGKDWEDRLSMQLFAWGASAMQTPENASRTIVVLKIAELMQLLRNPLDENFLKSPYRVGNEIWEGWMLEECIAARRSKGFALKCPFDKTQILISARVHDFARDMIEVLAKMPHEIVAILSREFAPEEPLVQHEFSRLDAAWKIKIINDRAVIAKHRWEIAGYQEREPAYQAFFEGRVSQCVEELFSKVDTMRATTIREMEGMQASYQDGTQALENNLNLVREDLEQEKVENRNNAARAANAEAQLGSLQSRISNLEADADSSCSLM